jgi:hypothetical protein
MTKQQIIEKLISNHRSFTRYISALDESAFLFSLNNEKWSAGQQAEHIYRSVFPLKLMLGLPKWITKLIFKKANRPSKSYEALVSKYVQRLAAGGRASGRFIPSQTSWLHKISLCNKIEKVVDALCASLAKYSEGEIDKLVLPHPLLGRLTLREMMYFTIHHVEHHHNATMKNLESK